MVPSSKRLLLDVLAGPWFQIEIEVDMYLHFFLQVSLHWWIRWIDKLVVITTQLGQVHSF